MEVSALVTPVWNTGMAVWNTGMAVKCAALKIGQRSGAWSPER